MQQPIAPARTLPRRSTLRSAGAFLWAHRLHAIILLPMIPIITAVHEAGHAAAVLAQGGRILNFRFLPTEGLWGLVQYTFDGRPYSSLLVSGAPYLVWELCIVAAALIAMFKPPRRFAVASTVFVWLYAVPFADIANTALPYLLGRRNDFADIFGPVTAVNAILLCALGLVGAALGYPLQRSLYRQRSVSLRPYALLAALATAGFSLLVFI